MSGQRIKGLKWRENIHFPLFGNSKKWRKKPVVLGVFHLGPTKSKSHKLWEKIRSEMGHEREKDLHLYRWKTFYEYSFLCFIVFNSIRKKKCNYLWSTTNLIENEKCYIYNIFRIYTFITNLRWKIVTGFNLNPSQNYIFTH